MSVDGEEQPVELDAVESRGDHETEKLKGVAISADRRLTDKRVAFVKPDHGVGIDTHAGEGGRDEEIRVGPVDDAVPLGEGTDLSVDDRDVAGDVYP